MKGIFKKKKQQPIVDYEGEVNFYTMGFSSKEAVEEIMKKVVEHEFVSNSPTTGEPISVLRASDIYRVICEYYDVDPKETEYSDYA